MFFLSFKLRAHTIIVNLPLKRRCALLSVRVSVCKIKAIKMRVVAMVSGGKDSSYNMMKCVAEGHEIVALANLHPKDKGLTLVLFILKTQSVDKLNA